MSKHEKIDLGKEIEPEFTKPREALAGSFEMVISRCHGCGAPKTPGATKCPGCHTSYETDKNKTN